MLDSDMLGKQVVSFADDEGESEYKLTLLSCLFVDYTVSKFNAYRTQTSEIWCFS